MKEPLPDTPQRHVVRSVTCVAAVLLSASALMGQWNSSSRGYPWEQQPLSHPFPDWSVVDEPVQPQPRYAGSNTVTFQQLRHKVPKKALQEADKAERARAKNRTDEAITHYRQAISIDPEFVGARNNLGALYLDIEKPEDAVVQLEDAAKIDPHHPVVFGNLAVGYAMMNKFDASENAARTAMNLDRTGARAPLLLGFALVRQGKFTEEALQSLERAHDRFPLAYLLTARVLAEKGDLERAKSQVRTYLTTGATPFRGMVTRWLEVASEGNQKGVELLPR